MKNSLIVNKENWINATQKDIWKVITSPEYFEDWMLVPGKVVENKKFGLGSKIEWTNERNVVYLSGEVIEFEPPRKLVISLQDISWKAEVQEGSVTYEFHLFESNNGTNVKFHLGDLSIDPDGKKWFEAYASSNEIGSIEKLIQRLKTKDSLETANFAESNDENSIAINPSKKDGNSQISENEEIIRKYYASYEDKDRKNMESLLAEDFVFCSPDDPEYIDRLAYFKECWPFNENVKHFKIEKLIGKGNEAFVQYECETVEGKKFRNVEFFKVIDGRITIVEVYYGS
ncbi:nuclear transport factor 2 family protein [Algoriphagus sp. NG3]|uniref:nuclear transport factor 2 family protein n=1 Tax=Algoriphagus sp. NG3 TaxID=3097546 RepID=UPI002A810F84|nr:nuclear transport factor 2 family protein [Algoriphagus sp. NG3]WPR77330.1 nuclear transport factor 2 family protein [Algoriphagus sp. NG3]